MSCNDAPSMPCYVCRLWAARLNIEGAQVQVAVYRQGTHPQLFSQGEDKISRLMRTFFHLEYATVRKKWRRTLLMNNKAVRLLLDSFFENLYRLMFEKTTQALRLPKGMET